MRDAAQALCGLVLLNYYADPRDASTIRNLMEKMSRHVLLQAHTGKHLASLSWGGASAALSCAQSPVRNPIHSTAQASANASLSILPSTSDPLQDDRLLLSPRLRLVHSTHLSDH
jgi:hypothetical protein